MALGPRGTLRLTLGSVLVLLALTCAAFALDSATYFQTNCASCHTIGGGPLVGPDLQNVQQQRDRAWLLKFLSNPQAMIDSGDLYAKKLLKEFNGMVMPPVSGLDRAQTEALLDWIEGQSQATSTQPATAAPSAPVFTPADASLGRELALGGRRLSHGGPACVSCHAFRGAPIFGGGGLGPDLTHEITRLGGGKAATAWLSSPPTPTMKSVYTNHALTPDETHALAAYLDSLAKEQGGAPRTEKRFFLVGLGGCLIALLAMDEIWRKRFRAVRRPLVGTNSRPSAKRDQR